MAYLQLPDGTYFQFDDALSDSQAFDLAKRKHPDAFGIKPQEGVMAALKKGFEQTASSGITGIRSMFGDPVAAAQAGLEQQQNIANRYADQVGWDRVVQKYQDPNGGLFPAIGEVARQVPLALAEQAPNIGLSIAGAKIGAMGGTALAPMLGPFAAAGPIVGGAVGAFTPSFVQQLGGNVERQQQETPGQVNFGTAATAALPQAALDTVGMAVPLGKTIVGKILGPTVEGYFAKGAAGAAEKLAKESLMATLAKGTAVGVMAEVPTEVAQQMIERLQAGLPLLSDDALTEYKETAYQTGLLGPIGAAGRFTDRGAARSQIAEKTRMQQAKEAADAAKADAERKQTPEYLQELVGKLDAATQQREALSARQKELRAVIKDPQAAKEDKRNAASELRALGLQLREADNAMRPLQAEFDSRRGDIEALQAQAERDKLSPIEALVGERAPQGQSVDTSFVDMAQAPTAPAAPPAQPNNLNDYIRSLEDPNAAAVGESTLDARQVADALLQRPDLARRVVEGKELFPGAASREESNLWKRELARRLKETLKEPAPADDSSAAMRQIIADREQMDRESLADQMAGVREQSERRRAAEAAQANLNQKQAAELNAVQDTADEIGAATRDQGLQLTDSRRTGRTVVQLENAIDEGVLTPNVARALRIGEINDPLNLRDPAQASKALPAIQARLQELADAQRQMLANERMQLTDAQGQPTRNAVEAQRIEAVMAELRRLEAHAKDALNPNAAADESMVESALTRATARRPSVDVGQEQGLQPQQYGFRAKELAGEHESLMTDLFSQLDELARGTFFKSPELEQRSPSALAFDSTEKVRQPNTAQAMSLERSIVERAEQIKRQIVKNTLQQAAMEREARGLPGLTQQEAGAAARDIRGALDALVDKARRVDDSQRSYVDDASKNVYVKEASGKTWTIAGRSKTTAQKQRSNVDPAYGQVRKQGSFSNAAGVANEIIERTRNAIINPASKPTLSDAVKTTKPMTVEGVRKGEFQLSPQSEASTQAMERRAAGEGVSNPERQKIERIENTIDRIEDAQLKLKNSSARVDRQSVAVLEKARQFLLNTTESTVQRAQTGNVANRDAAGALPTNREKLGAVTPRFLSVVDHAIERVSKGLPVEPDTGRAVIEHINSIETERQDQGSQPSLFEQAEPTALTAKSPEQFQRMLDSRRKAEPVQDPKYKTMLARLDDNIERSEKQVATLESLIERMRKRWYSDQDMAPTLGRVREARAFLDKLREQRTVLSSIVNNPDAGTLDGNKSSLVREVRRVNAAAAEMQKALAKAQAQAKQTERQLTAEKPVNPPREAPNPQGVFEQPAQPATGTRVTTQKIEVPDLKGQRGVSMVQPTWNPETGEYTPPAVKRRVVKTETVAPEAKKEALKEKVREEMEAKARQRALKEELKAKGLERSMTPEERRAMVRDALAASSSAKGEAIRKNVPTMGKGAPETKLRTESKTRESNTSGVEDFGIPPEAKYTPAEKGSIGKPAGSPSDVGSVARLREQLRAEKSGLKTFTEKLAQLEASKAPGRDIFRMKENIVAARKAVAKLEQQMELAQRVEASRKKKFSESPLTGKSTIERVQADVHSLLDPERVEGSGRVEVVASRDALPPSLRSQVPEGAKGVYADGTVHLIADQLAPGEARGVVLHELGVHAGVTPEEAARLTKEVERIANGKGPEAQWAREALEAAEASKSEDKADEALAYFVERAVNEGVNPNAPPGALGKIFKALKDLASRVLRAVGLRTDNMTAQDLVDFAYGAANKALESRDYRPEKLSFSQKVEYAKDDDPRLQALDAKIVAKPTSLAEKVKANILGFRTQFIDRFDPLEKIASTMDDSLKATQMMSWVRMYGQRNNFMSEVATNGNLYIDKIKRADGRVEYMPKSRSGANLVKIAEALRGAGVGNFDAASRRFKTYLVAERMQNAGFDSVSRFLPSDVTQDDLKLALEAGRANKAFQEARALYKQYNDGLIDFAVETGALSDQLGKTLKSAQDYVSFYRVDGDSVNLIVDGERIGTLGNLKSQPYLQELVGGDDKVSDFFDGALRNTHLLTDMALRNIATRNTAETLKEVGLAEIGRGDGPKGKNVLRFRQNGEDRFALVNTDAIGVPAELVVHGMDGIATQLPAAFKLMGVPARMLRHFIVRNPVYAFRQVFRDSVANFLMTGANSKPVLDPMKEMVQMVRGKSNMEEQLQQRGIVGGQVLTGDIEDRAAILKQLGSGKMGWQTAMAKLDFMAMQADAASRAAAYKSFREQGLSDMEATLAALETMNFNRRGISPTVHALGTMIPFMNAQIQGLDVLYRAARGKMPFNERLEIQRKFITRGAMIAAATLAYASMMGDDDDYKNASADERYNNWFIPLPSGDKVKVPIPFEPGYLFKSLPEAVYNVASGNDDARNVLDAFVQMGLNTMPGVIPQGVKPLIEAALNRNFFTGREIEDQRMQGLKMGERYGDRTTDVAKALGGSFEIAGREIGVSPAMIEHLVRGYTGSLGMAILGLGNALVPDQVEKPTMKLSETPIAGPLFLEKDATGAVSLAYKQIEAMTRAKQTFDKMVKEGREEEALRFADRYADALSKADVASSVKKKLGDLTKLEGQVRSAADMNGDAKRSLLDEIRRNKIELSRLTSEALR